VAREAGGGWNVSSPHNPPYKHVLVGVGWVPRRSAVVVLPSSLPPAAVASRTRHPPYEQLLVGVVVGAAVLSVVVWPCWWWWCRWWCRSVLSSSSYGPCRRSPPSLVIPRHLLTIPPSPPPLVVPSLAVFLVFQYLPSTLRAVARSGGGWAGGVGCPYYPRGGGSFVSAPVVNSSYILKK
jgi:hypothetical protein